MSPEVKNASIAAVRTAAFVFIGLFAMTLLGFVQGVYEWASSSGAAPVPDLSVLGYGAVAAACAAVIGVVNFLIVLAQQHGAPGKPPTYQ